MADGRGEQLHDGSVVLRLVARFPGQHAPHDQGFRRHRTDVLRDAVGLLQRGPAKRSYIIFVCTYSILYVCGFSVCDFLGKVENENMQSTDGTGL